MLRQPRAPRTTIPITRRSAVKAPANRVMLRNSTSGQRVTSSRRNASRRMLTRMWYAWARMRWRERRISPIVLLQSPLGELEEDVLQAGLLQVDALEADVPFHQGAQHRAHDARVPHQQAAGLAVLGRGHHPRHPGQPFPGLGVQPALDE